jgi:enoyl-CoA hydratase/carnithine racemase
VTVEVTRKDGVLTITLNRPEKKNALARSMFDELLAIFDEADADPQVRVVVITGAGGDFCSGADLDVTVAAPHPLETMERVNRSAAALHRIRVPVIAKVDGVAVGAGLNLALGCDLVIASDRARFSEIFAKRGLSVDYGGSWLLSRRIGLHRAKELCLLADIIDAQQAADIGLVNRVVPVSELDKTVDDLAARLAAGPPVALALTKRLLDDAGSMGFEQALDREAQAQTVNLMGPEVAEAFRAFVDKRDPDFSSGR